MADEPEIAVSKGSLSRVDDVCLRVRAAGRVIVAALSCGATEY